MCIIIVKQHEQQLPTTHLRKSAQINGDGLGIVWLDTFEVSYHKSKDWKLLKTNRPFIAHFRYATIGKINRANTHPFVCGNNKDELLMMNGTIHELGNVKECDTKILAEQLGDVPRQDWKERLYQYDCRFVSINTRTRTFQLYNKDLWTRTNGTWYSKDNVIQDNLVAVYGTLKKGFHNNSLLRGSTYIGKGVTQKKYPMVAQGIPYLIEDEGKGFNVDVQLYAVSDSTLDSLDSLEGHPTWYQRKEIEVVIGGKTWTAWIYFNIKEKVNGREMLQSFRRAVPQRFTFDDYEPYTPWWRQQEWDEGNVQCPDCHEPLIKRSAIDYECDDCLIVWPVEQLRQKGILI